MTGWLDAVRGIAGRTRGPAADARRDATDPVCGGLEQEVASGLWTVQAGIFPENTASVRLHEACGFRVVGRRERIGRLDGVWRDTLFLERRSTVAGTDS